MKAQPLPPKPCKICGRMYQPYRARQLYCSKACQKVAMRGINAEYRKRKAEGQVVGFEKVCPVCGKAYTTTLSAQIYCGADCRAIAKSGQAGAYLGNMNITKSDEHKAWLERYRRAPKDHDKMDRHLRELKEQGISYAEDQKKKTIEKFARIEI